ncbi:MAG: hypothetical protein AB7U52_02395 [Candidatus Izemoplasmatales bacterium]
MKIIKRLLIFLLVLIVIIVGAGLIAINQIKYEVTSSDLPQDVYETDGNFSALMLEKVEDLLFTEEEDSYTLIEDFINLLILDIIKKDINPEYDPLNGETEDSLFIINHEQFQLDYIYAHLNEENQLIITVSLKRDTIPNVTTAFHFIFDIDYSKTTFSLTLTLNQVFLHDIEVKHNIYDYFVSMADKNEIEVYVDKGTLNLDDYTYTINFYDLFL